MAGITRIKITDRKSGGSGSKRFEISEQYWLQNNELYRQIFDDINCPLEDGEDIWECKKGDIPANYDILLGIDVIFRFKNGMSATLQEKTLSYNRKTTVTIEYYNNPIRKIEGDWFHIKANYYFVGYDTTKKGNPYQEWVFLDWAKLQRWIIQNEFKWELKQNHYDNAQADFKYCLFDELPIDCVIKGFWNNTYYPIELDW